VAASGCQTDRLDQYLMRVAPLVVVTPHDLRQVSVHHLGHPGIDNGSGRRAGATFGHEDDVGNPFVLQFGDTSLGIAFQPKSGIVFFLPLSSGDLPDILQRLPPADMDLDCLLPELPIRQVFCSSSTCRCLNRSGSCSSSNSRHTGRSRSTNLPTVISPRRSRPTSLVGAPCRVLLCCLKYFRAARPSPRRLRRRYSVGQGASTSMNENPFFCKASRMERVSWRADLLPRHTQRL